MNFKEYQDKVTAMPLYDDVVLGLVGEVGEVIELLKKDRRLGTKRKVMTKERFIEEMGDVLWYFAGLATAYNVSLEDIAASNIKKLNERHGIKE